MKDRQYYTRRPAGRRGWLITLAGLTGLILLGWATLVLPGLNQPGSDKAVVAEAKLGQDNGPSFGAVSNSPAAPQPEAARVVPGANTPRPATTATAQPSPTPSPAATPAVVINTVVEPTAVPIPGSAPTLKSTATTPTATPVPASAVTPVPFEGKGTVQDRTFFSRTLNRNMPYRVYLPQGYAGSTTRYPVLYMLHGFSGSNLEWVDYGLLGRAEDLISSQKIAPMIIVLPLGEQGYWMNQANNGPRWAEYVARDVVASVDASLRTIPNAANRAIGGHSMGGHGALQIGFNYPGVFGILGAHSPTLRTKAQAMDYWGDEAYYATVDPLSLARTVDLKNYKIWLDIGREDTDWSPRVIELHQTLQDRGVAHIWNLWPGAHAGEYWSSHVVDYLVWYSGSFSRQG